MAKTFTIRNVSDRDLETLKVAAGSAGDCLQAAICFIALGGEFDIDDCSGAGLDRAEMARLKAMTRDEAVAECVAVLNDAASQS